MSGSLLTDRGFRYVGNCIFQVGPLQTNAYLVADFETHDAAVIDPAWMVKPFSPEAQKRGWRIAHLWYTHAHFDISAARAQLQMD